MSHPDLIILQELVWFGTPRRHYLLCLLHPERVLESLGKLGVSALDHDEEEGFYKKLYVHGRLERKKQGEEMEPDRATETKRARVHIDVGPRDVMPVEGNSDSEHSPHSFNSDNSIFQALNEMFGIDDEQPQAASLSLQIQHALMPWIKSCMGEAVVDATSHQANRSSHMC